MNEPLHCDLAVVGATVIGGAPEWTMLRNCDVVVRDGLFVRVGRQAASGFAPDRVLDGRDLVLLPGLVNAHTHSTETLARGLADGAPLGRWIEAVWSRLDAAPPDVISLGVKLAAAEMLRSGATGVVDHFRQSPMREDAIDAAAQAWKTTGMRTTLAIMVRDLGVPRWVPEAERSQFSTERQVALCGSAMNRWHGESLHIALAPSAPTRASDALLVAMRDLAADRQLNLHMHVDEVRDDTRVAMDTHGTTSVARLSRLGLLGPRLSIAHAVWVSDEDLDALAASGTVVVHNPLSNLRLGSGRAPVEKMLARRIAVAVGTDGAASNDTQHLVEAIKMAALLPRIASGDPQTWPSARDALTMGTSVAARALGMGSGTIRAGDPADFAAFDCNALPLVPEHDLIAQIVFAGGSLRARHVSVAGRLVVYDGTITSFDEHEALARARAWHAGRH